MEITIPEFRSLRDFIHDRCGIYVSDTKKYLIETRLSGLVKELGCVSFGEFYQKLKASRLMDGIFEKTINAITTNETLWFRDQRPFEILKDRIFPDLCGNISDAKDRRIRIWSAACSTGQEPYSIAITAMEYYAELNRDYACEEDVSILATDISSGALAVAKEGRYEALAIHRGLPAYCLDKYFKQEGKHWVIDPRIKRMIRFRQFNLKDPLSGEAEPFDLVFLRNVIIYFSDDFKKHLFGGIARRMRPGAYLMLGNGETTGGYSNAFELLESRGAIYYRLKQ